MKTDSNPSQHASSNNAAIIGAGVAGINAARHLLESGVNFDLFEATNEIGGRASRIYDSTSNEYIDNGQHLLSGAYDEFLALTDFLGTGSLVQKPEGLIVPYIDTTQVSPTSDTPIYDRLDTTNGIGKLGTVIGLMRFNLLNQKDKLAIISIAVKINLGVSKPKDSETCFEYLTRQKQTGRAIEVFWEPLILAVLNTPIRSGSAVLLHQVCKLAFFASKAKASLLFPKAELTALLAPIENKIQQSNSNLFKKSKVKQIDPSTAPDTLSLELTLPTGEKKSYNQIILALNPMQTSKLLPQINELRTIQHSPISSIYIWCDKQILEHDFTAVIGSNIQWIFNRTKIMSLNHKISKYSYSFTISASNNIVIKKPAEVINSLINDLAKIYPDFTDKDIIHYRVIHEKMATFSATPQFESIRKNLPDSIGNRIFIAGDWTNTGLPGTLESAALSGKAAASQLVLVKQ